MRYPVRCSIMTGLSLSQIGEFSFLLTLIAIKAGIISGFVYDFTIAAAFLTIVATPIIMNIAPAITNAFGKIRWLNEVRCSKRAMEIKADHLSNHVIICGFGPLGSSVGHILKQAEKEYIVLELNPSTVRKLRVKDDARPVYLGDGASAEILYKSGIERASVLAVTAPDYMNSVAIIKQARIMNSKIKIITRAKFRNQVEDLYSAGADIVISEELEAGIEMGRYILLHMGFEEGLIEQYIQTIRAFGSADFF
jgi:CPA2 family monovalent cation:H+ antiporter-2